jgi:hypothetical protein
MSGSEPTMIGLSERVHSLLTRMKEDGHFNEMADGYRLGIALALAHGAQPGDLPTPKKTVFSVATIDPDQELAASIRALGQVDGASVYKTAERLAEWGVNELAARFETGPIDVTALIAQARFSAQSER